MKKNIGETVPVTPAHDWWGDSVTASIRSRWLTRGKRLHALFHVLRSVEPEVLNALPPTTIYAPPILYLGCVYPRNPTAPFVYLSAMLEMESQKRVDFTVAHEIAHMVLRHHEPGNEQMAQEADTHETRPAEIAADTLAASWGFTKMTRASVFVRWLMHDSSITTAKHILRLMGKI